MGKNKGGFSLLESYMMANANSMETSLYYTILNASYKKKRSYLI